ncbi:DUF2891 domain-containing protein [uncultured Maribacter sp.]|uniref:DUF2891 domain-containing protein n=1 Tax=uncultured Maribacter sp. TaxID=431308 RepID=UPI00260CD4D3|nr:DUF2891 domain-containing protein [uncultured Maribacter sp.]
MVLKKRNFIIYAFIAFFVFSCKEEGATGKTGTSITLPEIKLTLSEANRLASLPLECMQVEFPNKLNQTMNDSAHLGMPKQLHPAFYGCFDWHSAVHGHWSLVSLLKQFPSIENGQEIKEKLKTNISKENIEAELAYFKRKGNATYERTYGWAWVLKLAEELHTWDTPLARELETNLQPLTDYIVKAYTVFLPKLNYPIRVGEHSNTAFGLSLALDYAEVVNSVELKNSIESTVNRFYIKDKNCPLGWEPSGFDFLSPCLEEANIVRRFMTPADFKRWLDAFLPQLTNVDFELEPGKVSDRADGKMVHLDGLNFSRAWCLYGISNSIPEYKHLEVIAGNHILHSLPNIVDGNYSGTHWLGTFALYSLNKSPK